MTVADPEVLTRGRGTFTLQCTEDGGGSRSFDKGERDLHAAVHWGRWRIQKFWQGGEGAEFNVSAQSSFIANAHNELYTRFAVVVSLNRNNVNAGEQSMWAERKTKQSGPKPDWSGAGFKKSSGAGDRRSGNGAVSGQNLPLKIRSTIKPLKVKSSKSSLKVTTKLSV